MSYFACSSQYRCVDVTTICPPHMMNAVLHSQAVIENLMPFSRHRSLLTHKCSKPSCPILTQYSQRMQNMYTYTDGSSGITPLKKERRHLTCFSTVTYRSHRHYINRRINRAHNTVAPIINSGSKTFTQRRISKSHLGRAHRPTTTDHETYGSDKLFQDEGRRLRLPSK